MQPTGLPAYTRAEFSLAPPGGPARRAQVVVSPSDCWWHWPEAFDPTWAAVTLGGVVVALRVEGLAPEPGR
jgi:hypothetical protein